MMKWFQIGFLALLTAGCKSPEPEMQASREMIDDTALAAQVRAVLLDDPLLANLPVAVDARQNIVRLIGTVNSPEQRARAEEIAWRTEGVQAVENKLRVKSPGPEQAPVE